MELSPPQLYQRVVASTLALRVTTEGGERYVGAAFIALRPDHAVTSWHLIRDAVQVQGTFSDGSPVEIREIIARDETHDLALLRITPTARVPLPIYTDLPPIASRLYAFGSPRGYAFSISDGLLSQVQTIDGFHQYQITCPFSPGNSGGPVVDGYGRVVGVSAWSKLGAQNLNFAIPSIYIEELLPPGTEIEAPREHTSLNATPHQVAKVSSPAPPGEEMSDPDLEGFQSFIRSLAGREVRITVTNGDDIKTFVGTVPTSLHPTDGDDGARVASASLPSSDPHSLPTTKPPGN